MYFADGHYFYFTCERADNLIKKKLPNYSRHGFAKSGFIGLGFDSFFAYRQAFGFFDCYKARGKADDLIERYGEPDEVMRRQ